MSKKTLLNENTIRRFMKLAEIEALTSPFLETRDPLEEDDMDADPDLYEQEEEPTPDELEFDTAEFEAGEDHADANLLYRWIPEEDKIVKHSESSKFFENISRMTGMSQTELNNSIKEKKEILSWLIKHDVRDLQNFGKVMNLYYTDRDSLRKSLKRNDIKAVLKR